MALSLVGRRSREMSKLALNFVRHLNVRMPRDPEGRPKFLTNEDGYWNIDWRADPEHPQTPEEHAKRARKYGLIPDDYKPTPYDAKYSCGDYPDLPIVPTGNRDPWELYDYPNDRRNFGEPLHFEFDIYTYDRITFYRMQQTDREYLFWFFFVIGGYVFLAWLGDFVKIASYNYLPRHKPYDGKSHLSFELEPIVE